MARKNLKLEMNPLLRGPSLEARTKSGSPFRLIPISEIDTDPDQPRRIFDPEALNELAASIREYGVICPILVRVTAGGTYRVVAGERRLRACRILDLESIPAVIDSEDADEGSPLAKQLVENLQRQDLSPMERALAVGQLRERYSWSIREIAKKLGASKALVQRSLEILALPDDLQAALIAGASESKVLLLQQIESREQRKALIAELEDLSRADLELRIEKLLGGDSGSSGDEKYHGGTAASTAKPQNLTPADRRLVEEIQRGIGTKVLLQRGRKQGQGKLTIEFYTDADLSEIHRRLLG